MPCPNCDAPLDYDRTLELWVCHRCGETYEDEEILGEPDPSITPSGTIDD